MIRPIIDDTVSLQQIHSESQLKVHVGRFQCQEMKMGIIHAQTLHHSMGGMNKPKLTKDEELFLFKDDN